MKIAYLYPHWRIQIPPRDLSYAMDIVGHGLTSRLPKSFDVVVYLRGKLFQKRSVVHDGILYRRLFVRLDRFAAKLLSIMWQFRERLGLGDLQRPVAASSAFFLGYAIQAALDIRRRRCDLVHIYICDQFAPIVRTFNPDSKIVLHIHDHSQLQRAKEITRKRLRCCDLIVGCSEFETQAVRARFPEIADRCVTIWNGTELGRFAGAATAGANSGERSGRFLFVGRLSPEKGVHVLLRAYNRMHANGSDAKLELVGPNSVAPIEFVDPLHDDPLFADLRRFYYQPDSYQPYLRSLLSPDTANSVTFAGEKSHNRTADHYQNAGILVFPSVWHEPFGLPVIEAMAAGLPVIATRGGAFPELVEDGRTGLLVEPGDVEGLTEAMERLAGDDRLRLKMGRAGQQRAREHFDWDRVTRQWLDTYERLASEHRSAG